MRKESTIYVSICDFCDAEEAGFEPEGWVQDLFVNLDNHYEAKYDLCAGCSARVCVGELVKKLMEDNGATR